MPSVLFSADDGVHGRELWRSDGTAGGTTLVADLNPGSPDSNPAGFLNIDGVDYFTATAGGASQIFRTDGTAAGTIALTASGGGLQSVTAAGDNLFWVVDDPIQDTTTLFVSDGSVGGTSAIATPQFASNLTALGGLLLFTANDPTHGNELWVSDGTAAGTHLLDDINTTSNSTSNISSLTVFNGAIYFSANDGVDGTQLWRTDGTAAGTQMVTDLPGLGFGVSPSRLAVANGRLFFIGDDNTGPELWATDGTSAGTVQLTHGVNTPFNLTSNLYQAANGRLYFEGAPQGSEFESLYVSDGTVAGTTLVANVAVLSPIVAAGSGIVFGGEGLGSNGGLFVSDGTPGGTTLVEDGVVVGSQAVAGGKAFVEVSAIGTPDLQLWVSDGTAGGTRKLADFATNAGGGPITPFGDGVLFSAPVPLSTIFGSVEAGNELWFSDGTVAGTHEVLDINPPSAAGSLVIDQRFVSNGVFAPIAIGFGSELVFAVLNGPGQALLGTDGTQAGTVVLEAPPAGQALQNIQDFTVAGPNLYFVASDGTDGNQLWVTTGVAGQTTMLTTPATFSTSTSPAFLTAFAGQLYFFAAPTAGPAGLYATDGTVAGTHLAADVALLSQPVVLDGELMFWGETGGAEGLYATNGASGNLQYLTPGLPDGQILSSPSAFAVSNAHVFFALNTGNSGDELWVSDGTSTGTHLVEDIDAGNLSSNPADLTPFAGGLVFTTNDAASGRQVWFTDGTSSGTRELAINGQPNQAASLTQVTGAPGQTMTAVGADAFFVASDSVNGDQLWVTDGTTVGTRMIGPMGGRFGDDATELTAFNGQLFFEGPGAAMITDGTLAGTHALASAVEVSGVEVIDGKLLFLAQTTSAGAFAIFVSDGTAAGTSQIAQTPLEPLEVAAVGDDLLYWAIADASHAEGLYSYNVLSGATSYLGDTKFGIQGTSVQGVEAGSKFIFADTDSTHGSEPWVTDGTPGGTFLLKDIVAGADASAPTEFTLAGSEVYFATTGRNSIGLWATDGTTSGTRLVTNLAGAQLSSISAITPIGADVYFVATSATAGVLPQLWDYNSVSGALSEVSVLPAANTTVGTDPAAAGGVLFYTFAGADGTGAEQLFDVSAGAAPLQLTTGQNSPGGVQGLTAAGDKLFFIADALSGVESLFVTDGTVAGTTALVQLGTGAYAPMTAIGGDVYFQNFDTTNGTELWVSDGTAAGTHRVTDTRTTVSSNASQFTVAGGQIFFSATDVVHGQELWRFTGGQGAAQLVADLNPGAGDSNPTDLTAFGAQLAFVASNGSGTFLWATDGSTAGTVELTSAVNGGAPQDLTAAGGRLFFYGSDPTHGAGLFVSDGTPAGTTFLAAFSQASSFIAVGSELYFQGFDATNGDEIWKSDGTAAGTVRVTSTEVDNGSFPQNFFNLPISPHVRADFGADGQSNLLIENAAGAVVDGAVTNGLASYGQLAGLGPEWNFKGTGDFRDDGEGGFLIENTAGAVAVGEVSGGQVSFSQVAALGPEWTFVGTGNLLDGGQHDQFLIENASGVVVVGDVANGAAAFTAIADLGPEWAFHGVGDFLHDGKSDFLIQNAAGQVDVGEVVAGQAVFTAVASLGPEWTFVGTGDFLGDGKDDFLIENAAGAVVAGEVSNGVAQYAQLASLGPEWKFVGAGDYLGEGHDQFLIENAAGAVVVGDWLSGQIHFTQVAALGPEWTFH